jgi:predicted metal-binding membrane protein
MNAMPRGGGSAHPWFAAPAAFIGMWMSMMMPMMLPALIPLLWRYGREAAAAPTSRAGQAVALAGIGYVVVWTVVGAVAFPLSQLLERLPSPAVGTLAAIAGAWQFTTWKARHLEGCRRLLHDARGPFRHGIRFGLLCARSCGNLMIISLLFGMMDLRVMIVVGIAIALERISGPKAAFHSSCNTFGSSAK